MLYIKPEYRIIRKENGENTEYKNFTFNGRNERHVEIHENGDGKRVKALKFHIGDRFMILRFVIL